MAYILNGRTQNIRTNTRKRTPAQELRVVRSVAPDQPELFGALAILGETTSNFVEYRDTKKLGVTLLMLGPLMRHVFGVGPGRRVSPEDLREVEVALNQRLEHAKYQDYSIPLQEPVVWPLGLYGGRDQYVGISLGFKDLRLTGDRAIVTQYFKDRYALSNRSLDKHLVSLRPHITIGEVRYDQMTDDQAAAMRNDPSEFILRAARVRQERLTELEGAPAGKSAEFPDNVGLNGLRIFCQPKGS